MTFFNIHCPTKASDSRESLFFDCHVSRVLRGFIVSKLHCYFIQSYSLCGIVEFKSSDVSEVFNSDSRSPEVRQLGGLPIVQQNKVDESVESM